VYAAFELRCAIERLLFETLYLFKGRSLTEEEVKRCRSIEGLMAVWREYDSDYRKTLRFSWIVASVAPDMEPVEEIEPGKLHRYWRDLSEYCHSQFRVSDSFGSPNRQFQLQGLRLIEDILQELRIWKPEMWHGVIEIDSMPPEVRDIYDAYLRNEIDDQSAATRLDLIQPLLRARWMAGP